MTKLNIQLTGMPYVPGVARGVLQQGMAGDISGRIVVLNPTELASFELMPAAFVVVDGAPFSHSMIPLLGSGVPTVIINTEQAKALHEGAQVLLDGTSGVITTTLAVVDRHKETPAATSCVTRDGIDIRLRVSARDARAARRAVTSGADAIGLLRSEFLVPPDGRVPDVDFYRHELKVLCEAAAPLALTIRLIDIAADKLPAWLPEIDGVGGVLGLQGARLFGHEPVRSVYRAQLAAIDELASQFDLKVLIPYLTSQDELLNLAGQIRQQLSRPIALGAMAETPAAALQIADWLEVVDFVALGCNDLMQCLFGADRDRPQLCGYLDPYAPALFRFLRQVAEATPDRLHRVQLCGVLPQLPGILPVLLGLGFRTFSVEAASLDYLRQIIAVTSIADARVLASSICAAHTSGQTRELLY